MNETETVATGYADIDTLSDRELLEEATRRSRNAEQLVVNFIDNMSKNPMMRAMSGMKGR